MPAGVGHRVAWPCLAGVLTLSPGPLTLTPLKLEPSLYPRRLSWAELWAGRQEPKVPPCLALDCLEDYGVVPSSSLGLSVPACEGVESLGSSSPAATPRGFVFELGGTWGSAEPSVLLGVQV